MPYFRFPVVLEKLLRTYLSIFAILILSTGVASQEYTVGVEDIDYYPIYGERDGSYSGFARELLDNFAQSEGIVLNYKVLPIKRLFNDFLNQKVDFKFPDSPYWKKDQKQGKNVLYSAPVLEYVDGVMVLPENLNSGKANLAKLGVVRGFTAWDYLGDIESGAVKIVENTSLDGLMNLVKNKRIDGVYFNVVVATAFLDNTSFASDLVVFDESLPHTRSEYFMSTIKHPEVIDKLNAYLKNNAAAIAKLKEKYNVSIQ